MGVLGVSRARRLRARRSRVAGPPVMAPGLRKVVLVAHVSSSVGWLGTVAAFLVLSIAGLSSQDADVVRGAYVAMDLIGRFVIVPMSFAALATGLIQAFGTHWGLLRYYWVLVKFALTAVATLALLLHQFTAVAEAARRVSGAGAGSVPVTDLGPLGTQLVGDAGLAILVLLVVTTLSVFKPWGRTRYGRGQRQPPGEGRRITFSARRPSKARGVTVSDPDRQAAEPENNGSAGATTGLKITLVIMGAVLVVFVVVHLAGAGMGNHGP